MSILLIEDNKHVAEYLQMSLAAEYFAVDVATDGKSGLEMALAGSYELVIVNNSLPKKNGLEICKEIRKAGLTFPILMLATAGDKLTKGQVLGAGADDYLVKPFAIQELLARTQPLLHRTKKSNAKILRVDDVILNTETGEAKRGDNTLDLTNKEFGLLEYFMQKEGSVLTREMLATQVWKAKLDPDSNTIETHMRSLRKKLDVGSKMKLVHTVPGVGYKLSRTL